jgi:hypothetical protein
MHNYHSESIDFDNLSQSKLNSNELNLAGESVSMQDSMLRLVDHTSAAQMVTKVQANI